MKLKHLRFLQHLPLIAFGVFLGHGAQAYTLLDFENRPTNNQIVPPFGDNATESSDGVTVVGFGTPNIGLSWESVGGAWQYYNDSVWTAAQLDNSAVGNSHTLDFFPNSAAVRAVVKSFNFHPYYDSKERFSYRVSLLAGSTAVFGPTNITFMSDGLKDHPVSINYTGAVGQALSLRFERIASTLAAGELEGDPYDIAVDDITFAQLPETNLSVGPQVVSVTPTPGQTGIAAVYYPFQASITNRDTAVATNSIRLAFDGNVVSSSLGISLSNSLTSVSYLATNLLASGSAHRYTLSFADTAGANYTNEVSFTVAPYVTLPAAYGSPPGSGITRGFVFRTVAAPQDLTGQLDSTVARAKAQLNGTLIDPATSQPYPNVASPGTNTDGSFNLDIAYNFADNATDTGHFPDDQQFPGLDAGPYNWFSTDALLYLDLAAGYHRFGVNSDDGFEFDAVPPQGASGGPIQLGIFDNGRAADDTLFDFMVPTSGLYGFRLIYFESTGGASCELFSVNPSTGSMTLVNDPADPNAIKSYLALKPSITSIQKNGTNALIQWAYGTAPFQLQLTTNLVNPTWSNVGSTTTNRSSSVPIQGSSGFIRVRSQ